MCGPGEVCDEVGDVCYEDVTVKRGEKKKKRKEEERGGKRLRGERGGVYIVFIELMGIKILTLFFFCLAGR